MAEAEPPNPAPPTPDPQDPDSLADHPPADHPPKDRPLEGRPAQDGSPEARPPEDSLGRGSPGEGARGETAAGSVRGTLDAAVRARRIVNIDYRDQSGGRTSRNVEAHGLVTAPYGEYLAGWCMLRDAPRLFRLDRIDDAALTARPAGTRDLDELLAVLRFPTGPRGSAGGTGGAQDTAAAGGRPRLARPPARARAWTLARVEHVRGRLAGAIREADRGDPGGAARLRVLLCHLAEWCRWQVAAVRAVSTRGELVFAGNRPAFPAEFDGPLPCAARERMIQDAMRTRSLPEVAADLDLVLAGAAEWISGSDEALWRAELPDPATRHRRRPLADLIAGWWSPMSHIEWHLDRDLDRDIDFGATAFGDADLDDDTLDRDDDGIGARDGQNDDGEGHDGVRGAGAAHEPAAVIAECPLHTPASELEPE